MSELAGDVGFLERRLAEADTLVRKLQDENAVLLRRALHAEFRIQDHYERKNNPDEVDRKLWGK
jgi:hypothetical protein